VDAIKAARQAVTLAEAQENWSLVGEQQILLAFAYAEQGDLAQAVALCQEAIAVFGKIEDADRLAKAEALLLEVRGLQTPD
jgi:tetratricopeptide (TPR) repeat protein